jgi:hypothetical protein
VGSKCRDNNRSAHLLSSFLGDAHCDPPTGACLICRLFSAEAVEAHANTVAYKKYAHTYECCKTKANHEPHVMAVIHLLCKLASHVLSCLVSDCTCTHCIPQVRNLIP